MTRKLQVVKILGHFKEFLSFLPIEPFGWVRPVRDREDYTIFQKVCHTW
jgi:hypothetical protein